MANEYLYSPRDWAVQSPGFDADLTAANALLPQHAPVPLASTVSELSGPAFDRGALLPDDNDLTRNAATDGVPMGTRIVLAGQVTDESGRPMPGVLVEIWHTNASGRYALEDDRDDAPLDPHFYGSGRCLTDGEGRYRFRTIRPGNYPVPGEDRWRAAHIHFSLYGPSYLSRLATQMYFPGDPLLATDKVFLGIPDDAARDALVARYAPELGEPRRALGYRFDIVMRHCRMAGQEA